MGPFERAFAGYVPVLGRAGPGGDSQRKRQAAGPPALQRPDPRGHQYGPPRHTDDCA